MLRKLWLFAALFAMAALSSAFSLDDLHIDGIEEYLHHGEKRQASGTGNTPSSAAPPTSSAQQVSSAPESTPTPTPTQDPTSDPVTSNEPASSTPAPAPSSANNQPTSQQTSAAAPVSSNKPVTSTRTTAVIRTTDLVSTSLQEFITTYTTISDGQAVTQTSTGTSSIVTTTGQAVVTDPPTSQENSGGSDKGLSQSSKNIIGGVVGGIGGALLLAGIGLVFWRMKKRQHKVSADDDDLMANTGAALGDKPSIGSGSSPFQSNLEQYHNPGGRPNAAANF
ncbi:hypothetical protein N0V83_008918 [Neocucurbitaria cava]|uniref:Mid2 domain-containing protein n=1 Tax=Neocucurbitaria cava TaxID=798079 RepID=A0A9W9CJD6_9PLEO|nr:hypothetical protein N0V83_008918 [Neocucurbitaria cava]